MSTSMVSMSSPLASCNNVVCSCSDTNRPMLKWDESALHNFEKTKKTV